LVTVGIITTNFFVEQNNAAEAGLFALLAERHEPVDEWQKKGVVNFLLANKKGPDGGAFVNNHRINKNIIV